ncbi:DUF2482 family protein [Staphylococcus argenteus]|uniref:DUF2482 family protein n=1 Tax=Staphylococcus argenteus TaxID=985002 RepID=UPI001FBAFE8D|nr:DUF2482 family protein [Staphylococcus argenteus]MCG9794328.1 DUF2482 family protein [Staphylococcus argenteus]GJF43791.1 hypothetical protein SA19061_08810 [Staphylococcus argenteus]GJF54019.1 hypothetical protein SA19088_07620 [Staphylococcus argenteus]GJF59451.1 hypothetical protein SA19105_09390 [Staphylococcus argenteus]GJF72352.1 hypothetical protein SA19202_09600 [Staphylococcus argenteus]
MKNESKNMSRQEIIDVIKEKADSLRATIEDVKEQTDFDISINLQLIMSNGKTDNNAFFVDVLDAIEDHVVCFGLKSESFSVISKATAMYTLLELVSNEDDDNNEE